MNATTSIRCDVCLTECPALGTLACQHRVCQSCGMSQSRCLVCAQVGGKQRQQQQQKLGKRLIISRATHTARLESISTARLASPSLDVSSTASPCGDEGVEPPLKVAKREDNGVVSVQGPTAYDEVRCELRPMGSAPTLARSALRTTGKLSVGILAKFVHSMLGLEKGERVVFKCSGEELGGGMTLGQLVTHVWPEGEGHMVLDYRIMAGGSGGDGT